MTAALELPSQELTAALLRLDFEFFLAKTFRTLRPTASLLTNWHHSAIAYQLERVRTGGITRLIINTPPRSLKSVITSVAYPAYLLGRDPSERIICVSYAADLARALSNDFRAVIEAPWYKAAFPGTRIGRFNDAESEVAFTRHGFRLATSTGGSLTGRGGNFILIDDPFKPIDALSEAKREAANQWFANTLLSRLDDKRTGRIVIVMQRLHIDDLVGFVTRLDPSWTVLNLPAIAEEPEKIQLSPFESRDRQIGDILHPEREPLAVLNRLKQELGSDIFSAQYQQAPVPAGGAMIKRHWIVREAVFSGASFLHEGHSVLGHRQQGRPRQRLVSLHDLVADQRREELPD